MALRVQGEIYPSPPSIHIVPTLGSKVYKYYLLWTIWSPRVIVYTCTHFAAL